MSKIGALRDALGIIGNQYAHYDNKAVVNLAKIVSAVKLEPKVLLERVASTQDLHESSQLLKDGFVESAALANHLKVAAIMAEGYQYGDGELGLHSDGIRAETLQSQVIAGKELLPPDEKEEVLELKRTDSSSSEEELPAPKASNIIKPTERQKTTKAMHDNFLWHTRWRLAGLRLDRLLNFSGIGIQSHLDASLTNIIVKNNATDAISKTWLTNPVSSFVSLFGLSYFPEGGIDIATLLRIYFRPTEEEYRNNPDAWSRVVHAYYKGNRPGRIWNLRWAFGNLLDIILPPILLAASVAMPIITAIKAINDLVWFISDLVEDGVKCFFELRKYNKRLAIIEDKIERIKTELTSDQENINKLEELAIWQRYHALASEKKKVEVAKCWRAIRVSAIIVVGMAMVLLPQFLPLFMVLSPDTMAVIGHQAFKIAGAAVALMGSVYGGLGKALWDRYVVKHRNEKLAKLKQPSPDFSVSSASSVSSANMSELECTTTYHHVLNTFKSLKSLPSSKQAQSSQAQAKHESIAPPIDPSRIKTAALWKLFLLGRRTLTASQSTQVIAPSAKAPFMRTVSAPELRRLSASSEPETTASSAGIDFPAPMSPGSPYRR